MATAQSDITHEHRKRHRVTVGWSTLASILSICVIILPVIGWLSKGTVVSLLSEAMAGEISKQVNTEVQPVNDAFKVLMQNTIAELEDDISRLQYKKQHSDDFTPLEQQELTNKMRRLAAAREALDALKDSERGT